MKLIIGILISLFWIVQAAVASGDQELREALAALKSTDQVKITIIDEKTIITYLSKDEFIVEQDKAYRADNDLTAKLLRSFITASYDTENGENLNYENVYIEKQNGEIVNVGVDDIHEVESKTPGWHGLRTIKINIPKLQVGDVVHCKYIYRKKTAFGIKGSFEILIPEESKILSGELVIQHPLDVNVRVFSRGLNISSEMLKHNNIVSLKYSHEHPISDNNNSVSPFDYSKSVVVSAEDGFENYSNIISNAFESMAQPSSGIINLADEIAKPYHGDRAKIIEAIFNWVKSNIKYTQNYMSGGAIIPKNTADSILHSRSGDCKDQVLIFKSLLKSQGIDAYPVVTNLGNRFDMPNEFPNISYLNHVLVFIPYLNKYTDPTTLDTQFDMIPNQVLGKKGLILEGNKKISIKTLPISNENDILSIDKKIILSADSYVSVVTKFHGRGLFWGPLKQSNLSLLSAMPGKGKLNYSVSFTKDEEANNFFLLSKSEKYKIDDKSDFYAFAGDQTIFDLSQIANTDSTIVNEPIATYGNKTIWQKITIDYPSTYCMLNIPTSMKINSQWGSFKLSSSGLNNSVIVDSVLSFVFDGSIMNLSDYSKYKNFISNVINLYGAKIHLSNSFCSAK